MAHPSTKPSRKQFIHVANSCGGILSDIAANFSVTRQTVYIGAKKIRSSNRPLTIPANGSSILQRATSASWSRVFRPLKRMKTGKSVSRDGLKGPQKRQLSSLSRHAERTGAMWKDERLEPMLICKVRSIFVNGSKIGCRRDDRTAGQIFAAI